ncbi:MAG: MFS transporter [Candidatus Limnocylindrales bacterium]
MQIRKGDSGAIAILSDAAAFHAVGMRRDPPADPPNPTGRVLGICLATGLASTGLAAGGTGGALLAVEVAGNAAVAGLPFGLVVAGSALGALLIGALTPRLGRLMPLALGHLIGVIGAVIVLMASWSTDLGLILAGSLLLGPANASVFMARYTGADLFGTGREGRGIGAILLAAGVGAVMAPNLLEPAGLAAEALGLPVAAGLYLVAVGAFGAAGALLAVLAPRSTDGQRPLFRGPLGGVPSPARRRWSHGAVLGIITLGAANMAMVGIMAVAPIHLTAQGHDLRSVGLVISIHVAGMLGPSPITGWLVDRIGPRPVAAAGGSLLLAAGVAGALVDHSDPGAAIGFLLALGVGWNLAVVAGSSMLTSSVAGQGRYAAEARGEVAMGVAAAVGAPAAGLLAAMSGFGALSAAGAVIGAIAVGALAIRLWTVGSTFPREDLQDPSDWR